MLHVKYVVRSPIVTCCNVGGVLANQIAMIAWNKKRACEQTSCIKAHLITRFLRANTHNVDKHDGSNHLQEMRVGDDSLGDVDVVEDPVHAKVLCHNVADHQHEANVQSQRSRHTNTLSRNVQTQNRGDV